MDEFSIAQIKSEMYNMLDDVKELSYPSLSGFKVACIARGNSGKYYIGSNVEVTTHYNLHAEQAAIHNAYKNGESGITHLMLSALPCGHCRQFLFEVNPNLLIFVDNELYLLADLLPNPFLPKDLGIDTSIFQEQHYKNLKLQVNTYNLNNIIALDACKMSYSPFQNKKSGVSISTNKDVYSGSYIENVAFNPSVLPMMSALSQLFLNKGKISEIIQIDVIEEKSKSIIDHYQNTKDIANYLNINIKINHFITE